MEKRARVLTLVVLISMLLSVRAAGEDYRTYFPRGWAVRVVPEPTIAAIEKRDPQCLLRAHGWKLLGTEKRVADGRHTSDTWQQWGWQIVVVNPSERPTSFRADIALATKQARALSTDTFPEREGSFDPSQESPVELLPPTTLRVFSGAQWYNPREHEGAGVPSGLRITLSCDPIAN